VAVPAVVANKARHAGAQRWLTGLPGLIAGLERDWDITVGRPFDGATEAYVARARLGDGTPAVLKLMIPRPGGHAVREMTVLRLANGDGCVRLLRCDAARGALLLERLGRSLDQLGLPIGRRHEILCATASRIWRPAPGAGLSGSGLPGSGLPGSGLPGAGLSGSGLPDGREKARRMADHITGAWDELGRPCSARAVDHALACAARRAAAHDDERAVPMHGDVHQWNVLEADGGFRLVDPDGVLAEAECDLGVIMREDPVELLTGDARDRARWLAQRCGLDATAIWEWGVAERVSTGLLLTGIGLQPVAGEMLAAADHLAGLDLP
jgi:streptomycin 6-kinase